MVYLEERLWQYNLLILQLLLLKVSHLLTWLFKYLLKCVLAAILRSHRTVYLYFCNQFFIFGRKLPDQLKAICTSWPKPNTLREDYVMNTTTRWLSSCLWQTQKQVKDYWLVLEENEQSPDKWIPWSMSFSTWVDLTGKKVVSTYRGSSRYLSTRAKQSVLQVISL